MNLKRISDKLKPLYHELLASSAEHTANGDFVKFCIQWGKEYPETNNDGIIFYGRANNGWMCFDEDAEEIFNLNNPERAFARDDQMTWVEDLAGENDVYNSNRSAFWRIIRGVSKTLYPNDGLSHIAWSNLCKITPDGGNPSDTLYYAQLEAAQKIMAAELDLFKPKHVILMTGENWAADFLKFLNNGKTPKLLGEYEWGTSKKYSVKSFQIGNVYFYLSEHPQGKNEATHINALLQALTGACVAK